MPNIDELAIVIPLDNDIITKLIHFDAVDAGTAYHILLIHTSSGQDKTNYILKAEHRM